jgi:site-specific DNA recombinase
MRAAVYARVSTERQERFQTIDSQLAALRAWAADHGHALAEEHVFRDEGYSGSRLDRPGLDALRDAVRDGAVGVVAVLTPDRLARKYAYQVLLLEEFRRAGCEMVFLQHPISDDPNDQLLLQIQGAIAEYERAVLGERFRRGKLQRARDGHYLSGCAPYGYRYVPRRDAVPGHLVVDEHEAETVRMLYGWLVDEGMTLRQILKRLNFGPWFPRCGRRPWSPSTVHHILADPVYTGTAYANRYRFVPPKKPRRAHGPRTHEASCRQLKPREQWIAIPVPALIDQETWDRAQAQLARNAALSFRNNKKHSYLLRCLLTCGSCGLTMFGRCYGVTAGQPERRYYRCAGKDCIETARPAACPSRSVKAEAIEAAVWGHVAGLLADPDRLLAQFDHVAATAEAGSAREQAAEQQLRARLDRVARADKRLLDAYEAGAVSLDELSARRRHLAEERHGLERRQQERERRRHQRLQAQAVRTSLAAFCARIRGRLDTATFADKQAILQLVVERIIVGDGSLEIRHVIPLRSPPPGRDGTPDEPNGRLRSDRVHPTALPRRAQRLGDGVLEAFVRVRDHQLHALQPAADQPLQERRPEGFRLRRPEPEADDLASAIAVDRHSDDRRDRDDPATFANLQVGGIQPKIGPFALQRPLQEGVDALVDVLAQLGDRALGDARQPHRLNQLVDPPGRDAADPSLLDDGDQRLLAHLPRLEERREVGTLPELGDTKLERAQAGIERAVAIPVAPVQPLR